MVDVTGQKEDVSSVARLNNSTEHDCFINILVAEMAALQTFQHFQSWFLVSRYGLFQKNPNRGGGYGYIRLKKIVILDLSLYPWKFQRKQAFTSGNSAKLSDTPWKFQGQKQRPLEIPHVSNKDPWNFHFFFNWSLEFPYFLFSIPLEMHVCGVKSLDSCVIIIA